MNVKSQMMTVYFSLIALSVSSFSHAQLAVPYNQLFGSRAQAMGGAYRAIANTNEGIYFNPAGMSILKRLQVDVDYTHRFGTGQHWVGGSVVDSETSVVTLGLDYHLGIRPDGNQNELSHAATAALGGGLYKDYLFFGASAKYLNMPGIVGDNPMSRVTGDVGVIAVTPIGLTIGAVGYNLIPTESVRAPLSFGVGAAFSSQVLQYFGEGAGSSEIKKPTGFTLAFDWVLGDLMSEQEIKHELHVGAEYVLVDLIPLRAGYQWNKSADLHTISLGAGLQIYVIGLDFVFTQQVNQEKARSFGIATHLVF